MPRFYHAKAAREYHSREHCQVGSQIPEDMQEEGSGGLELCHHCAQLARNEAEAEAGPTFVKKKRPKG